MKDPMQEDGEAEKRVDFRRQINNTGEEIEVISFYRVEGFAFQNPPSHSELIEEVIEKLKGTGIAKLTITFLNENL